MITFVTLDNAPLTAVQAKMLAREIVQNGKVHFRPHALRELAKDGCATVDALSVLRGGAWQEAEFENGEWRHQVRTPRMCVVVHFDTIARMAVVTAWKYRR